MKKIYIFGMGKGKEFVDRCLLRDQVECVGYVNNFCSDSERVIDGIPIIRQDELKMECDYIIITLMQYKNTKQELIRQGIKSEKLYVILTSVMQIMKSFGAFWIHINGEQS